jgi:hypothetical protein
VGDQRTGSLLPGGESGRAEWRARERTRAAELAARADAARARAAELYAERAQQRAERAHAPSVTSRGRRGGKRSGQIGLMRAAGQ